LEEFRWPAESSQKLFKRVGNQVPKAIKKRHNWRRRQNLRNLLRCVLGLAASANTVLVRSEPALTMPIYEYQCEKCEHQFDALQKLSDKPLKKCPECGKMALTKLISAAGFRLKGGGWYETDFKSGNKKNLAGDSGGGDSKSSGSSSASSSSSGSSAESASGSSSGSGASSGGKAGGGKASKSKSTDKK